MNLPTRQWGSCIEPALLILVHSREHKGRHLVCRQVYPRGNSERTVPQIPSSFYKESKSE